MNINVKDSPVYYTIIADGYINQDSLEIIGADLKWVDKMLVTHNIVRHKDVFLMLSDTGKNVVIVKKEGS